LTSHPAPFPPFKQLAKANLACGRALVANVLRQIERFESGLPLEYVIDCARGY
jgi:hypothetical protein